MIRHFQIEAQTKNAFEVAEFVIKQVRFIKDLEQDGTPEGVSKVENVQEILNKAKNFTEEQRENGKNHNRNIKKEERLMNTRCNGRNQKM